MAAVTNTSYDYNDNPGDGETNMVHTFVKDTGYSTRVWRANSWFLDSYCIETEDAWSLIYTNPYDLWATGEVYDAYDTAHVDKGIAYVEGRET